MRLPTLGRWSRLLALGYGIAVFVWLSLEDIVIWPVIGFGLGLAILILLFVTFGKMGGRWLTGRAVVALAALFGLAAGLGTSVAVAALMFFKNARHAHLFPDYPAAMILAVLERAPAWATAGGLAGLGLGLGWLALRGSRDE